MAVTAVVVTGAAGAGVVTGVAAEGGTGVVRTGEVSISQADGAVEGATSAVGSVDMATAMVATTATAMAAGGYTVGGSVRAIMDTDILIGNRTPPLRQDDHRVPSGRVANLEFIVRGQSAAHHESMVARTRKIGIAARCGGQDESVPR